MHRTTPLFAGAFSAFALIFSSPAIAACPVPNTLTNGQVADATQMMDNFSSLGNCAVSTAGSPSSGSISVFSGDSTIVGGNLTGDVTTAGSTSTTLAPSGVAAGTYTNAQITVDAKGRVTSASNGSVWSGGSPFIAEYTSDPTNTYIDIQLGALGGSRYRVILEGLASVAGSIVLRLSTDNGATFAAGASDYKTVGTGGASGISLGNSTVGGGRDVLSEFTIVGLNTASGRPKVVGTAYTVASNGAPNGLTVHGGLNGAPAGNYNAIRIVGAAGALAGFTARLYAVDWFRPTRSPPRIHCRRRRSDCRPQSMIAKDSTSTPVPQHPAIIGEARKKSLRHRLRTGP